MPVNAKGLADSQILPLPQTCPGALARRFRPTCGLQRTSGEARGKGRKKGGAGEESGGERSAPSSPSPLSNPLSPPSFCPLPPSFLVPFPIRYPPRSHPLLSHVLQMTQGPLSWSWSSPSSSPHRLSSSSSPSPSRVDRVRRRHRPADIERPIKAETARTRPRSRLLLL